MKFDLTRSKGIAALCLLLLVVLVAPAMAATGYTVLPATLEDGLVTVFYPTDAQPLPVQHGQFSFNFATDAAPRQGNGRLVIMSHGSGGSPWVGVDLAELLVARGFVVAMPEHQGDNYQDMSGPGPDSWTKRPGEVSRAIEPAGRRPAIS